MNTSQSNPKRLALFEGFGVELEYMVVDRETLHPLPLVPWFFEQVSGWGASSFEQGGVAWSNEIVRHVLELKTRGPVSNLGHSASDFSEAVLFSNQILAGKNAMLMPTGMHPWLNPLTDTALWLNENKEIYECYDRIFNCHGHGWSNLQSTHLNLPFADDSEFAQLHTAIRLILPLLPGLCASSPCADGKIMPWKDYRLEVYRHNQEKIPSIAGQIIPDVIESEEEYRDKVLFPMYRDIAPFDPEGVLQDEWLNSRGAIARFDRYAIEIRLMDIQECPARDLAVHQLVTTILRGLIQEKFSSYTMQKTPPTNLLKEILLGAIQDAGYAKIYDANYLTALGIETGALYTSSGLSINQIWRLLAQKYLGSYAGNEYLYTFIQSGTLSERIVKSLGHVRQDKLTSKLKEIYHRLAHCLESNTPFNP